MPSFINKVFCGFGLFLLLLLSVNTDTHAQVLVPDIAVAVSVSPTTVVTGSYATYTVTIQNIGTVAATNVNLAGSYAPGLSPGAVAYVSGIVADNLQWLGGAQVLTYNTFPPGATSIYKYFAKPICNVADAIVITNSFVATASVDADLSNNTVLPSFTTSNPAPTFSSFPADITAYTGLASTSCNTVVSALGAYTVADNCPAPIVTITGVPAGNIYPVGTTVLTYTVLDDGGAQNIQTQNVFVVDNTVPAPDVVSLPVLNIMYGATITVFPTATDNCAGALTGTTTDPLTYATPGTYTITWAYDDGNGNISYQTQTVNVLAPDILVNVTVSPSNVLTGTYAAYTVTIQNIGTTAATNVQLAGSYATGLSPGAVSYSSGLTADNLQWSGGAQVLTYNSFPAGGTSVYRYFAKPICSVSHGTNITIAFVATADVDYDLSNNTVNPTITTDNPAPTFTSFPADINTTTGAGAMTCDVTIADLGIYTVDDNCPGTTVALTGIPAGNIYPVGATVITYTATDAGGAQTILTQNVNVSDDTPPLPDVASLPDVTIMYNVPITVSPTAVDNCAGALTGTTTDPLTYATPGTYTITWAYDDGNGNISYQTQTINVVAPDILVNVTVSPSNVLTGTYAAYTVTVQNIGTAAATNVQLAGSYATGLSPGAVSYSSGITADNLQWSGGAQVLTYNSFPAGGTSVYRYFAKPICSVAHGTNITIAFVATADIDYDLSNNTVNPTITTDNPAPTFTSFPADINTSTGVGALTCDAIVADLGIYTVDDNCPGTTVALTGIPAGNIYPVGTTVITYTATDAGGAQTVLTQNVNVTDDTPPVPDVAVLPTLTVMFNTPITVFPTATDNCAGALTASTTDPLVYSTVGTYTITWTYDDGNGNTSSQTQTVDIVAPDIDVTVTVSPSNVVTGTYAAYTVTIQNIGNAAATNVQLAGSYATGLSPGAVSYSSGITADNLQWSGGAQVLTYNSFPAGGTSVYRYFAKPICSVAHEVTITNAFQATADADYDLGNNTVNASITTNNPPPTYTTFPVDINVTTGVAATICAATVNDLGAYAVDDNCAGTTVAITGIPAANLYPVGTTVITYTATDAGGAQTIQTQNVNVSDDAPAVPDVFPLASYTAECQYTVTTAPTATDNCAGTLTATTTQALPWTFNTQGTHTITWTYDDGNGNFSTQDQLVVIDDISIPVPDIALLPDFTDECSFTISTPPTATDNCSGTLNATTTQALPWTFNTQGTHTITWTYDDGNGNTTTQDQDIVIDDITAPMPDIANLPVITGECDALVTVYPTATDNCVGQVVATTTSPLSYSAQGSYTVTWDYDDGNGNTSSQTQTVVIDDITAPVPDLATLPDVTGECSAAIIAVPTASDNCTSGIIYGTTTDPLSYTSQGTFTVTWSYDDGNGNVSTQVQTVIVRDVTPPIVICPAGIIVEADANGQGLVPDFTTGATATDNCSSPANLTWSQNPAANSYVGSGVNTVTVTAYDEVLNPGTCTTTFEVVPRVMISPSSPDASVAFGCSSPLSFTRSVTINNSGGHFGNGVLMWSATSTAGAITITASTGSEGDALEFSVNPAGLAPGNHTLYITIVGWNSVRNTPASNSPYSFPVYVEVQPNYTGPLTQTKPVTTSWTQFTNSYGHVFAEVKSNSGTIASFTATAHTCSHPNSYPRVNFVNRYFNFSSPGSVNVDIRTYYTDTETKPRVVQPQNLTLWQQPLGAGAWFNRGGTSNVTENYVELTSVSALTGNWMPAHPWVQWYPKQLALTVTGTSFNPQTMEIALDWRSLIRTDDVGFLIERCYGNDPDINNWYEIGMVDFNGHGDYSFSENVEDLGTYHYRISTWDSNGNYYSSGIISIESSSAPSGFVLSQNYPNPFNPETVISYTLPVQENVTLKVYDMFWREVETLVDAAQQAGTYETRFNAAGLPSGTYFYQMQAGSYIMTHKMSLTK